MPRKSKYESHIAPYLEDIKQWRAERLSIASIAKKLSIGLDTLNRSRAGHPELEEALKAPELTKSELFEKQKNEHLNRAKYYNSTLSFVRNHATKEERYKIIQTAVQNMKSQEEIKAIHEILAIKEKEKS